jgi:hypothetical protein
MSAEPWKEFWDDLGVASLRFADVGLAPEASDKEIWHLCQARELVLLTGNRNARGSDSLEQTIRHYNTATCLPVLTLANSDEVFHSRAYADRMIDRLLDFLMRIDALRGTGRLYLP